MSQQIHKEGEKFGQSSGSLKSLGSWRKRVKSRPYPARGLVQA